MDSIDPQARYTEAMGVAGPRWARWLAAFAMIAGGVYGLVRSFTG